MEEAVSHTIQITNARSFRALVFLLAIVITIMIAPPSSVASVTSPEILEAYGKLPLSFEANQGQTESQVEFLSRGPGYTIFVTPIELVLSFRQAAVQPGEQPANHQQTVLRMQLIGATPPQPPAGMEELPGKVNYFIGADPKQWHTNIPTYTKVKQEDVYPGVAVVYYGNQRQLEFDFIVAPGANPNTIRINVEGAERLEVDAQGDLILYLGSGKIRLKKPLIYQVVNGARQEVPGSYVLQNRHQVGFRLASYDARRPLVIDPTLLYSTYLGGTGTDYGNGIAVDTSGNAYVTGQAGSTNFPTTSGTFQTTFAGGSLDAFVTKLSPTGSTLVYSTYLGGTGSDFGTAIAVDTSGHAYVTGIAFSTNFPTTAGAFQTTFGGNQDAFVTKLNPTGSALLYSTYLGGTGFDQGLGIAVDTSDNAYVSGLTTSSINFPTTAGASQTTYGGNQDAFVTKLNPSGSGLVYSTYLGGTGTDYGNGVALDTGGHAYVTGQTNSNFPTTVGAFQTMFGGFNDAFVTKLNPTGTALLYSTYLGGTGTDFGTGIAVDTSDNAYVTGGTDSTNFPTTAGAFQSTFGSGGSDVFVTKLNPTGTAVVFSTYLGGTGYDYGNGVAVDTSGNAHVTGITYSSTDFPTTTGALQTTFGGGLADAFMTKLNATGTALVYSTYLGGTGVHPTGFDYGLGIAVDTSGNAYVTGVTSSTNFPTTAGAFQTTFGSGSSDAFVAKIAAVGPQVGPPTTKDACKHDGWRTFNTPRTFKNQGDCIQFVNTGK